jgi:hypothetical protein
MTLDMVAILIDSVLAALDSVAVVDQWVGLLFIACIFGVGSGWALSLIIRDQTFRFVRGLF